ncbi:MAG: DUF4373 domain-containing protein [Ignavibacteriales bacterium]|nr:DUF4373 domain-containing protein [Ignavibacteriales bacterium]
MSKESFYFPHDFEPTSDPKMQALIGEYGAVGYGIFWRIVEMLHSDENHKLPMKQYIFIAIAKQMLTDVEQIQNVVKYCIEVCELLVESDGFMYSNRVNRNFDKRAEISEKRSIAGKLGAIAKQNLANTSKEKKNKIKENKIKDIYDTPAASQNIQTLMIRTFGRNPTIPEQELIQNEFIRPFGWETTYRLFKEASLKGFKKLITLRDSIEIINNKPHIKERENGNYQGNSRKTQNNNGGGGDDPGERELLERLKNRPYKSNSERLTGEV